MNKSKVWFLSVFFLASIVAHAQPGELRQGKKQGKQKMASVHEKHRDVLGLNEDQITELEKLKLTHMDKMQKYKAEQQKIMASLQAAIINDEGKKTINEWVVQRNNVASKKFEERINHQLEVRAMLSDEQKIKFDQRLLNLDHQDNGHQRNQEKQRMRQRGQ